MRNELAAFNIENRLCKCNTMATANKAGNMRNNAILFWPPTGIFSGASLCVWGERECACINKCDIAHWHENNLKRMQCITIMTDWTMARHSHRSTTEHVACTFNEQSQILNAQKANYELIWTGNTPNFIIYLWVCDGRVLTNCFFLFLCVSSYEFDDDEWQVVWWNSRVCSADGKRICAN